MSARAPVVPGQRYGKLIVIAPAGSDARRNPLVRSLCDCGRVHVTAANRLASGHTQSCGCLRGERAAELGTRHGGAESPEWWVWTGMRHRARRTNGIPVCARWQRFEAFRADLGPRPPGARLRRLDPRKGHGPGNTVWWPREIRAPHGRRPSAVREVRT